MFTQIIFYFFQSLLKLALFSGCMLSLTIMNLLGMMMFMIICFPDSKKSMQDLQDQSNSYEYFLQEWLFFIKISG